MLSLTNLIRYSKFMQLLELSFVTSALILGFLGIIFCIVQFKKDYL
ncbi:hypothetical protein [Flavobacterium phage FCL-2]|uniref:Uncharacterized protein n=1 Tax=Flavobacterium phage FCL-2 TaxID=908819 RepID=A0A0F7NGH4_9CAUD|nr:hypothetical protein ABG42_gp49 [Flavobacterium phage FCL-2]AKH87448.1 hypothetical protein [Flavobacterium phage FCL-2]